MGWGGFSITRRRQIARRGRGRLPRALSRRLVPDNCGFRISVQRHNEGFKEIPREDSRSTQLRQGYISYGFWFKLKHLGNNIYCDSEWSMHSLTEISNVLFSLSLKSPMVYSLSLKSR